ncbi:hypothetical protein Pan265_26140 [Mucisphaera calidilacus]|uniref:Uncharacterized protein n=2 Tax=Mucisphaera calidilacus TaxID=2527982 RepID=A0A518C0K9_9BACT|nr:hypothetical protein Pan265_26140 [Mucisphaera calidilacus]
MRCALAGLMVFAACCVWGCTSTPEANEVAADAQVVPAGEDRPLTSRVVSDGSRLEVLRRVELLLEDEGFVIERVNQRFGSLRTLPAPVPVAGEFWAGPSASGSESAVATMTAMRRIATARVEVVEGGVSVIMTVEHERLRHTDRRLGGNFGRKVYYDTGVRNGVPTGGITMTGDPRSSRVFWSPAGRDVGLEERLLGAL